MDFDIIGNTTVIDCQGYRSVTALACANSTVALVGEGLKVLPASGFQVVGYAWLKFTGMKRMALADVNSN